MKNEIEDGVLHWCATTTMLFLTILNWSFQKYSKFVGRENIIADIFKRHEQVASQKHSRVAFVGLGGVG